MSGHLQALAISWFVITVLGGVALGIGIYVQEKSWKGRK